MKNKHVNSKSEVLEDTWEFRTDVSPNENEIREIFARVVEIGTRAIFENLTYKFGGKMYKQNGGSPIGARASMAAS